MFSRDYRDILGGLILLALGLSWAGYAFLKLDLGTVSTMGEGMFPAGIGVILAGFGAWETVMALSRRGTMPQLNLRGAIFVLAGVSAFALLIVPFGMVAACTALVLISSHAKDRPRLYDILRLTAVLCILMWAIFILALGSGVPLVRWPF